MEPLVSVVVLNYNGKQHLEECLNSVLGQTYARKEILLVDNFSSDGSQDYVKKNFPQVRLIENKEPLGFAGGNNVGIKAAKGDFIVLLSNDTVADEKWIEELVKVAVTDPKIGILGCKIYYYGEPDRVWFAGGLLPSLKTRFGTVDFGGEKDRGQYDQIKDVEFICGCSMMLSRQLIDRIGLLDPTYFLYWEDTDLCFRARKAGFRMIYVPKASIRHKISVTTVSYSPNWTYYFNRSRAIFGLKNFGGVNLVLFILFELFRSVYLPLRILASTRNPRAVLSFFMSRIWVLTNIPKILKSRRSGGVIKY